ncbi:MULTISPECIES: serine/threonine-protein kinase [unclassified Nocardioides]|uniref:serine/threonine-protein kinase n=1 Tax=unclassified Nocardioides TaxID=2615069 RepID=UPI0006F63831|nr:MULTISPECIES: serine/threonine-protein kinase [unclassified Nocardioides]KRA29644.1 serine/threonine protein kinase [Nocardioides sp. Root614]KRA88181.1 serine/threonine protein kinase [Nocardioides sp. Root682]
MSAGACTQPGCTGSIVDGYCDVCGMAGTGGTASPVPAAAPAASAAATSGAATSGAANTCQQPGCTGRILDGYCDVCGSPAVPGAKVAEVAALHESQPLSGREGTAATAASRVQSAAIGSKRAGSTGSLATRRTRTGSQRMRSARLGAGLTVVPPAPPVDAAKAIMANPQVPEDKRSCSKCGKAVGRSIDGTPGRSEGFCPNCGQPFSFTPKLVSGDLVAGQYEVAGALAHGGLGWIYLARDRNVSNRWVVLKGLLNSGDPDALAAAIAEQQFLAQVEHPLIVEIYNFVTHEGAGYIVMEYVGGKSLKQILKQRMSANNGEYDPLPVDQALAYILELLPAFQYLHDLGLVYCDFKPDNMIQVGDAMKLIDLGGVRRIDDQESAIYGTVGYQAPEVAEVGPTVASDIYTIGRTLVVLTMEFRGYQGTYLHSLPPVDATPLFQQYDSLYHLLAKCCAPDPADRFASVDELRTQVLGVLREVVARRRQGTASTSAASVLFESPATARPITEWSQLPKLREDSTDPQYSWLTTISAEDPKQRLADLLQAPEDSAEVWLARARASLDLVDPVAAKSHAQSLLSDDPWEWRALWIEGLAAVQAEDWETAKASFNAVYQQVPGELAPKLALAFACERGGLPEVSEGLYQVCASTDAAYVPPAAFGMARVRAGRKDTAGAVAALDLVPTTSRGYTESRQQRAEVLLSGGAQDIAVLDQAMRTIETSSVDGQTRQRFTVRILGEALPVVSGAAKVPAGAKIGSVAATEAGVRDGLENALRSLARDSIDLKERVALVNQANAVRNWSLT